MSAFSIKDRVSLSIETHDETADIYVIDGTFRVVERGRGISANFQLKPGIYTVKVRVGFESREKDVVLQEEPTKLVFQAIEFPSAIPLANTARTHEYHIYAAESESRKIHRRIGNGSWIFIFSRDWKPSNSEPQIKTTAFPHKGLTLKKGGDEDLIVNIENAAVSDSSLDAWAACNIEVDPGLYRVSVEIEPGKRVEQTIVACRNWQTQVFFLQRNYDFKEAPDLRRADLGNTGILMAAAKRDPKNSEMITGGFNALDPKMRLLDLARLGLTSNRQILSKNDVDRILWGKFNNPMLGILGGHLLLKSGSARIKTLKTVVTNLRHILGEGTHPDVEALALRIDRKNARYSFELPPMLRQSWIQVVTASKQDPGIVPVDSFAGRNAGQVLNDEPWLLFLSAGYNSEAAQSMDESFRYLVKQQLLSERGLTLSPTKSAFRNTSSRRGSRGVKAGGNVMRDKAKVMDLLDLPLTETETLPSSSAISDKAINNIVDRMAIPKSQVYQILRRLENS